MKKSPPNEKLGMRGFVQIAGFHEDNSHVAVYGRGAELPHDRISAGFL